MAKLRYYSGAYRVSVCISLPNTPFKAILHPTLKRRRLESYEERSGRYVAGAADNDNDNDDAGNERRL